ncbi:6748_t:CDS:2 [Rhizophagus irregularis]|nr:6748_t:CDS:2 [Rhizophagus irregularis]
MRMVLRVERKKNMLTLTWFDYIEYWRFLIWNLRDFYKHLFNCICIRYWRKLVRKLKSKYEPIPFVSGRTKNFTLEERIQSIENLLEEYTDFLKLLLEDNNVEIITAA